MPQTNRITKYPYDPEEELQELLHKVKRDARLHYEGKRSISASGDYQLTRLSYTVTFDGSELEGTETTSPIGVFVSLSNHLGFAASVILTNSLAYGQPTKIYVDKRKDTSSTHTNYRDLTAEWYPESVVEAGLPEARVEDRVVNLDPDPVPLSQLENWAADWLNAER